MPQSYQERTEQGVNGPIYLGRSKPGTAEGDLVWQIRKNEYDGDGNLNKVTYAGGSTQYTKSWTDRASYTYS